MRKKTGVLLGAAFLMATSAIGPGFLTQTTVFTGQLGAAFGFVILLSFLLDLGAQVNIWRVVTAAGKPAPEVADHTLKGLGAFLTIMILFGGFAFNIGNVAGAGLGLESLAGIPVEWGAALSGVIAMGLFSSREAGLAVDRFSKILGVLMIALTAWVAFSHPFNGKEVLWRSICPDKIDPLAVLTIVGGTVGGYISFAGAHRLLEAGLNSQAHIPEVSRSAFTGIGIATLMRVLLFLAAFGVISAGGAIDPGNPPASVFRFSAGETGQRFFGLVMWSAAITSVVGCTFTTVSFLVSAFGQWKDYRIWITNGFILLSTLIFITVGKPVKLLVWAGAVNGLILPLALGAMLIASRRSSLMNGYRLPAWWVAGGWLVVLCMGIMAGYSLYKVF